MSYQNGNGEAVMSDNLEGKVAVALDRTHELMKWRNEHEERHREELDALGERLDVHGKAITELKVFKDGESLIGVERRQKEVAREKRLQTVEKKLDTISIKFMILWGGLIAVVSTLLKYILEQAIQGKLVH